MSRRSTNSLEFSNKNSNDILKQHKLYHIYYIAKTPTYRLVSMAYVVKNYVRLLNKLICTTSISMNKAYKFSQKSNPTMFDPIYIRKYEYLQHETNVLWKHTLR
jgi:hypothetical protein